jgi:Raf kinase inhibitor-like YbhB/YbcL family protein
MLLTSPAFEQGGKIPSEYTCDGKNISPELNLSNIPPSAKSLALIMEDPDVPQVIRKDRLWVHWVVFNISPSLSNIAKNAHCPGSSGINTGNQLCYMGPCPPDKEHRYYFNFYALDCMLDLPEGQPKQM